jgi:PAS domain S-box-containing protein
VSWLDELFSDRFMPHGHCYLWDPGLVWLHTASDALVALSYTTIPFTLYYFQRRRRDLPFNWMFLCFALFIIACGATHYMEIWTLWHGTYWLAGVIKAITALASVPTAFLLVRLVPQALAIPHPDELREAYAALRVTEARFRAALDGSLDAFLLLRAVRDANGAITDFDVAESNARAETLLHKSRAELLGHRLSGVLPGAHFAAVFTRYVAALERRTATGEELGLDGEQAAFWEHQLVPVEDGLAVTLRDITARKRAELHIRESEERFRALLEAAPDAMVITRSDGTITLVNAQTEELFGWDRAELVGKPIETLVPDRFRGVHAQHRAGFSDESRRRPMGAGLDLVAVKDDGTEFPVEISLSPIHSHGVRFVSAAIRDVTDRKRVEEQIRASLLEKEALLKEVHHRVKNNLQVISSLLNLQAANITDPAALEMFRESQDRVRSIAFFHEHLYQSRDLAHVDLAAYLRTLGGHLITSYGAKRADVTLAVRAHDEVGLSVDKAIPCGLMINELISNALKHGFNDGQAGEILIEVRGVSEDQLTVVVADDGAGLPKGYEITRSQTLGHQLVLTLVRQIGGSITVEPGPGARFVITFNPQASGEHRVSQDPHR